MLLVIGGTGELGSQVVRDATASGVDVRVLARPSSDVEDLLSLGAEVVRGDLADPESLTRACDGVDVVVATANTIVPRRGERTASLIPGYLYLAEHAEAAGVRRFVFVSVPTALIGRGAAEFEEKAEVEAALRGRSFELCVVRPSLFMESWLPAVGSRLAVDGHPRATLDRGFWLSRLAGLTLQRTIDLCGIAQLPGSPGVRHSFVSVGDVAAVVTAVALARTNSPTDVDIGGPAALTWREVAEVHGRILGRRVRSLRVPAALFAVLSWMLSRISPTASNLLAVQALVGLQPTIADPAVTAGLIGRTPVSVEEFLQVRGSAFSRE